MSKGLESVFSAISNTVTFLMQSVNCVRVNYEDTINDVDTTQDAKAGSNSGKKEPECLQTMQYDAVSGNDDVINSNERISHGEGETKRRKSIKLHILFREDSLIDSN